MIPLLTIISMSDTIKIRKDKRMTKEEHEAEEKWEISKIDSADLIHELYLRGITIRDIFGRYYEFDEAKTQMTIEDTQLAGYEL